MAALAYVLLPVSGLLAYFNGASPRMRFHGLQAILLGLLWPVALYGGSAVSPTATRAIAAGGGGLWIVLMITAALGKDVGPRLLKGWAEESPKAPSKG
jgi:uncharacterized membrane protein